MNRNMTEIEQAKLELWDFWTGEDGAIRLIGKAYGHAVIPAGSFVSTDPILEMDTGMAMTRNALYVLGEHCAFVEVQ